MHSALSVCIISLRMVNVIPRSIHDWIDKNDEGRSVKLDTAFKNIGRQELMASLRCRFETDMWKKVTPGKPRMGSKEVLKLGASKEMPEFANEKRKEEAGELFGIDRCPPCVERIQVVR